MKNLVVCTIAIAMLFALTTPAIAADWAFYGSARFATFSSDADPQVAGVDSDTDTQWGLQGNSRIGARVSAGAVGGRFEYGSIPNLRYLYGTWNFGVGIVLVGQADTPLNDFYCNQVWDTDDNLHKAGMVYHGRREQVQLRFGGFDLALVRPNTQPTLQDTTGAIVISADNDTTLPQIIIAYRYSSDLFYVKPFLGWATYDFTTNNLTGQQEPVDSLVYGLGGKVNIGPAFFAANIWAGSNVGNMGVSTLTASNAIINATNGMMLDNDTLAYAGVVGFKANDVFTIEGGYGHVNSEIDAPSLKTEDTAFSYYIQTVITLASGVSIVPELGIQSNGEIKRGGVTTKENETTYFGAKWQINF